MLKNGGDKMYDLNQVRNISCEEVAILSGIQLKERGNILQGKIRSTEKTPSFTIWKNTNSWYDFGAGEGGSVIDLTMKVYGIDSKTAINKLGEDFRLRKIDNKHTNEFLPLTDNEYKSLNMYPKRVSANGYINLDIQTDEEALAISEKYKMTVAEFSNVNPKEYNDLITEYAMDIIEGYKVRYDESILQYKLNGYFYISHDKLQTINNTSEFKNYSQYEFTTAYQKHELQTYEKIINKTLYLLEKGLVPIEGKVSYSHLRVDATKDIKQAEQDTLEYKIREEYKKQYNFSTVDLLNNKQLKTLHEVNKLLRLLKGSEQFIFPVSDFSYAYHWLGKQVEQFDKQYCEAKDRMKNANTKTESYQNDINLIKKLENNMIETKELFLNCQNVVRDIKNIENELKARDAPQQVKVQDLDLER